jgi:hypothetical protein
MKGIELRFPCITQFPHQRNTLSSNRVKLFVAASYCHIEDRMPGGCKKFSKSIPAITLSHDMRAGVAG